MENKKRPEMLLRALEEAVLADDEAPAHVKAAMRLGPTVRELHRKIDEALVIAKGKVREEDATWLDEAAEYFKLVMSGVDHFLSQSRGTL